MSATKYGRPQVLILPEDDADREIADGFALHDQVSDSSLQVLPVAGGWSAALNRFQEEYLERLRRFRLWHLVMLIDFDNRYEARRNQFDELTPEDLKPRVFVVGPHSTPESLRVAFRQTYEEMGLRLADECWRGSADLWGHELLRHNDPDRRRMIATVRPILFPDAE